MIVDFRVHLGLDIIAAVRDRRIGCIQLDVLDAVGDTAERKCLVDVCKCTSVDLDVVDQGADPEFLGVIKTELRADLREDLDSDNVHRLDNTLSDSGEAFVALVPVPDRYAALIAVRLVDL